MNKPTAAISISCILAALAGYLLARQTESGMNLTTHSAPPHRSSVSNSRDESRNPVSPSSLTKIKTRTPGQLASLKQDLRTRFKNNPSPSRDWAFRGETSAILATMSAEELAAFADEIFPATEKPNPWQPPNDWRVVLKEAIYRQWGLMDPAAACLHSEELRWGKNNAPFNDWLKRDPEAAQVWINGNQFPPDSGSKVAALKRNFVTHQAESDFESASRSLADLDPDSQANVLFSWSENLALNPENRMKLLRLLMTRENDNLSRSCIQSLVRAIAGKSTSEAAELVENSGLPEDRKAELRQSLREK